jgi:hypothetical protein
MIVNATPTRSSALWSNRLGDAIIRCCYAMPCLAIKSIAFNAWDDASLSAGDRGLWWDHLMAMFGTARLASLTCSSLTKYTGR